MPFQLPAMKEESEHAFEHARVFHQLLGAIEAVRITRQEDYREKHHPQLKRFTQQELNDEACPTYKNWLIGRSYRLPSRSLLMTIADYLECSLSERNDLLLAAQYVPEQPEWEGADLQRALEYARQIMATFPYPASVVTRTFQIHAANELFLRLFELPPIDTIPPHQRSTIHFLFHPDVYRRSTMHPEARAKWQQHALSGIQLFKRQNVLSQYDAWLSRILGKGANCHQTGGGTDKACACAYDDNWRVAPRTSTIYTDCHQRQNLSGGRSIVAGR